MSIESQGHFFTIYFPGIVCFVLYWAKISGERLQDHWSSGLYLQLLLKQLDELRSSEIYTCMYGENGHNHVSYKYKLYSSIIFTYHHENKSV